jgi:hypothetical protein
MTWLTTLYRRWRDRPDKAWKATGYVYRTERTYDYAKAVAARRRALQYAAAKDLQADLRSQPVTQDTPARPIATVTALRRRA